MSTPTRLLLIALLYSASANCGGGGDHGGTGPGPAPQPKPVASVQVSPATLDLIVSQTATLTAQPLDASGNPLSGRTVTWLSVDAGVATVSDAGLVSAIAPGTTKITATAEGKTGSAQVTVGLPPATSVTVTPGFQYVGIGRTAQLTATALGSTGVPIPGKVFTWTSSAPGVATVNASGIVSAVSIGTTTLTATVDGVSGSATVRVVTPVTAVEVRPDTMHLGVGQAGRLVAVARSGIITVPPGMFTFTWASSRPDVATIDQAGVVSPVAVGTAIISATTEGITGTAVLRVQATPALLEIHQINVGWGNATLVRGPSGITVLLDGGNTGMGTGRVVPYLRSIGIDPATGLDITVASHQHCDHVGGLDEVVQAGYDIRRANYVNGSTEPSACGTEWRAAASGTTAGAVIVPPLGTMIPLGNGGWLMVVAVNGRLHGGDSLDVSDENDRSIAIAIKYNGFDYLWAGDLGGGADDAACTGRATTQRNVESLLINAIMPPSIHSFIAIGGIDVLHVNNHGSESSTNSEYMNRAAPAVALIGTGAGQGPSDQHPRTAVVERVLGAGGTCVTAPPALVLQTEEGAPLGPATSVAGYSVGDIVVTTDGWTTFRVNANGAVSQGPSEVGAAGLPRSFPIDDGVWYAPGWRLQGKPYSSMRKQ